MQWSRAKSIIIFILAALNIFLGINLYLYNTDRVSSNEAVQNAQAILNSRNILIKCKVPNINGVPKRLNFINDGYDMQMLVGKLIGITGSEASKSGTPVSGQSFINGGKKLELRIPISFSYTDTQPGSKVDTSKTARMEKYAVDFLKKNGLMPDSYVMDSYVKNPDNSVKLIFIEKYGKNLIYDNYLEVTATSEGITNIMGSRRSIKKAEAVSQEKIMTAWQVMLRNFTGNTPLVIEGVDFGYKQETSNAGNMKASLEEPVWRIKVRGGDTYFFNAFNGYRIK